MVSLDDIRDEIEELDTPQDRLGYLIELGDALPSMDPVWCTEENRVLGCQSMVWLITQVDNGRLRFLATSDAPMVRGLIAILQSVYSGKTPREILEFPIQPLLHELKLDSFLSPMRSNGLHSMIQRIRQLAILNAPHLKTDEHAGKARATPSRQEDLGRPVVECRSDFPILQQRHPSGLNWAYLDNAASSQRPVSVLQAIERVYSEHYSNVHRSGHAWARISNEAFEGSRQAIAGFLNAQHAHEVLWTSGTTAAINLVARAWGDANITSGDRILLSEMEHHSNIVPWQQLAGRTGAVIDWIPVTDDFQLDLDALPRLLTPRTKIMAVTAVSNVLGTINPVGDLVAAAHRAGCLALIDAAQWVPHGDIDVQELDADFLCFSGHKMMGPSGVGCLYAKASILESMPPYQGGGSMIQSVTKNGFVPAGLPYRFEAGTPPIADVIAMKAAVDYLTGLGSQRVLAHEQSLAERTLAMWRDQPAIRVFGPSGPTRTGIVTFTVDGMHADDVGRLLDAEGIAIRVGHHCAMPLHERLGLSATCRASFYAYNTLEEAQRLAETVVAIAKRFRKAV
jgi:cysteine desulfurase/selenocysteine lyase